MPPPKKLVILSLYKTSGTNPIPLGQTFAKTIGSEIQSHIAALTTENFRIELAKNLDSLNTLMIPDRSKTTKGAEDKDTIEEAILSAGFKIFGVTNASKRGIEKYRIYIAKKP